MNIANVKRKDGQVRVTLYGSGAIYCFDVHDVTRELVLEPLTTKWKVKLWLIRAKQVIAQAWRELCWVLRRTIRRAKLIAVGFNRLDDDRDDTPVH